MVLDTPVVAVVYVLEIIFLYVLVARVVRTVWFRQTVLTLLPLGIACSLVQWYDIPLMIGEHTFVAEAISPQARVTAALLYYFFMGLASGFAFRKTRSMFGFPLGVFFVTLALHFHWLIKFGRGKSKKGDPPICDSEEDEWMMLILALCSLWTLREFGHLSTIAGVAMAPATIISGYLAYEASEMATLHDNLGLKLFSNPHIISLIEKNAKQ